MPPKPYYEEPGIQIYLGDCRDILPQLPKVDLVLTDPPYGMKLDARFKNSTPNWKKGIGASKGYDNVVGDDKPFYFELYFDLLRNVKEQFWFGADYYCYALPVDGSWLVWDKRIGIEDVKYSSSEFELIWSRKKHLRQVLRHRWFGLCGTETQDTAKRVHPCQKPIRLINDLLLLVPDAQTILDPFMGSGTTLVAARDLGRKAIGIEVEEKYCAIAVKRLRQTLLPFTDTKSHDIIKPIQEDLIDGSSMLGRNETQDISGKQGPQNDAGSTKATKRNP